MNIIFLTIVEMNDINDRSIYHDLLRKFRDEGHSVYVLYPTERRTRLNTEIRTQDGITLLRVKTLNLQKTNVFEKGIGTILLENQFLKQFKSYFSNISFDLLLYSTPPITLAKVIEYIKKRDYPVTYLLLKDIFPQNAIDLGMIKRNGILHRFFKKKEKRLYQSSDHIGCMSPANINFIIADNPEIDPDRLEVNPNSISPRPILLSSEEKQAILSKYHISQHSIIFVYGGNLGKPQGVDFLIEVLQSNINKEGIFFLIVGSGTEYKHLHHWFQRNTPLNMRLLKGLPKNEYDKLVNACDVGLIFLDKRFTIPNFPARMLSYLESRLPVLAATDKNSDVGKIIVAANCGFWSESGDLSSFNNHIDFFLKNKHMIHEMGENSYQLLIDNYTVDISYNSIIKHFK
jgi:glycosyltransferase involved in cell wall biosynthesis